MLIAILILTIFNTGMIFILGVGGVGCLRDLIMAQHTFTRKTIESDIEQATTAIFNMDSLKQKATMSGKAEL